MTNDKIKEKIDLTIDHIRRVQENGRKLAFKLIDSGDIDDFQDAIDLLRNIFTHDDDKFSPENFESIVLGNTTQDELKEAIERHNHSNLHHPETFKRGIESMSNTNIMEMCCDWKSRSEEKGTCLKTWIKEEATKRFGFEIDSDIYKEIMKYIDMLVEPPFEKI